MESGMELEQGEVVEEVTPCPPRDEALDLEEGELREDDPAPVGSTGMESDSAGEEQERTHRRGKRRSEGTTENGDEHELRHSKRSKKASSSSSKNHKSKRRSDDSDEERKSPTSDGMDNGADDDGEGKKRKNGEDRSSANHHRHHHRDHHRDKTDEGSGQGGGDGGSGGSKRSRSSTSPSSDRRAVASDDRDRRYHRADRDRRDDRDRERERDRDRDRGRSRGRDERDSSRYERDDINRDRSSRSIHAGSSDRDSRSNRRSGSREDRHTEYRRRVDDYDQRDYRRSDRRDYRDDRDRRQREREEEEAAERKRKEEEELRKKKEEEERYAKMVEEELRRKEKEQTEEEKAQKLIEERRRRRQAILEKYKQDKNETERVEKPNTDTASAVTSAAQPDIVQVPQVASQVGVGEAAAPAVDAAADNQTGKTSPKAQPDEQPTKPAPKAVTHFDMFSELSSALIPSPEKLAQPARAAAANGEDELNLQDNWDDEEGYYSFRIGEVVNKRYTIHASHGKGVFSTVLMAKDNRSKDAEVAIKVIRNNDTMYRAGLKEMELLEKITKADPKDKRHCIRVLDSFQYRNHLCIVLEPMNLNLREVIRKFGRDVGITMQAVRTYARQLFLALRHLRALNILHADLKPDNIVLNQKLTVLKLCDFGSASTMDEDNAITPYLVSRFYRAPEIILGLPYDFGIDVWAAGCCLYEMYTGKILFPGKSNNEMLKLHMDAMGPFPRKMLRKAKFASRHFNPQTFYFQQVCVDEVSQQEYVKEVNVLKPARDLRGEMQRAATSEDAAQVGQLADLLIKCLAHDPAKRITPEQALAHPFLSKAM